MMKANTKVLTAHVPINIAEKLDQLSEQLDRTRGWIIKQALTTWITQQEEYRKLTMEALADVDVGNFVSQESVQTWADSLDTENPLPVPEKNED
jgi:predicted transcriptional regulator